MRRRIEMIFSLVFTRMLWSTSCTDEWTVLTAVGLAFQVISIYVCNYVLAMRVQCVESDCEKNVH